MVGLVLREHLMVLLRRCMAAGGTAAVAANPVAHEELSRHVVTAAARSYVSEQQMAVLQASLALLELLAIKRSFAHAHSLRLDSSLLQEAQLLCPQVLWPTRS